MLRSFFRYCVMGGVNICINVGVTAFMHEVVGAPEELAYATALLTLLTINFFASRHFVYQASSGSPRKQLVRFVFWSGSFRLLEYVGFLVLHSVIGVFYLAAAIVVQVTSFLIKFLFYRNFVFVAGGGDEAEG